MHSFYRRFLETAEKWPENIALELQHEKHIRDGETGPPTERHTYRELRRMAESVGKWLNSSKLEAGARCALLAANSPQWVGAYLGVIASGRIAVPLDTAFKAEQIRKLIDDSGATILFTDGRHLPLARKAIGDARVQLITIDIEEPGLPALKQMLAQGPEGFTPADPGADDTAIILYTSGTTSDPKGVMVSHRNLLAEMEAVFGYVNIGPTDTILGVLPLFHSLAQMANLYLPLAAGTRVVYLESLNTTELLRALRERDITLFCCVPQFFYLIHERVMKQVAERSAIQQFAFRVMKQVSHVGRKMGLNLGKVFFRPAHTALGPKMRYLVTGGSRFDPKVGNDLADLGFEVLQAYGLTEVSGGAVATPPDDNVIGSVGKPLPGVEVKIVDGKPSEEAGGREVGEIALRGGIVMKGYYKRPDATEALIKDGWFHTGDLGYIDENGNLFITGRAKDIIVLSNGKNVYPEEIEAHYAQSEYIKEICVVGIDAPPGEPVGERLHAVIVPDLELAKQRKVVNVNEWVRWYVEGLSAELPPTKRILSYDIWQEELPRTTTRKLKRHEILRRVKEQHARGGSQAPAAAEQEFSEEDQAWMQEPDVAKALAVIRKAAKKNADSVRPSHNLELDLGLDSMGRVELLVAVEGELGGEVPEEVSSEVYTVRELVEAVRATTGSASGPRPAFAGWEKILMTDPTEPEVLRVAQRNMLAEYSWFLFGRFMFLLARDLFHLRVYGLEKLPPRGPYLICPNHSSFLDPIMMVACLPWQVFKNMFYVGTSDIFGQGFKRWLGGTLKLVPVDPDANLVPAMRAGAFGLRKGKILMLYPEGERSIDRNVKKFKKGAAILSAHLQVPIYPVAHEGFHEAWPRGKSFVQRLHPLQIAIGDPIYPPKDVGDPEQVYQQLTTELRQRVIELWEVLRENALPEEAPAGHDEPVSTQ